MSPHLHTAAKICTCSQFPIPTNIITCCITISISMTMLGSVVTVPALLDTVHRYWLVTVHGSFVTVLYLFVITVLDWLVTVNELVVTVLDLVMGLVVDTVIDSFITVLDLLVKE